MSNIGMKRMILSCLHFSHTLEDRVCSMKDLGYYAMARLWKALDFCAEMHCQTLEAKTNSKNRKQILVFEAPKLSYEAFVLPVRNGSWTRACDDRVKAFEQT